MIGRAGVAALAAACSVFISLHPASATEPLDDADMAFITEVVDLIMRYHGDIHDRDRLMAEAITAVERAQDAVTAGPPQASPAETGIKAFVETLGPHNFYATARQFEVRRNWFAGAATARLGIIGTTVPDGFAIRLVYPDGPAEQAGILPDDLITALDGAPLAGLPRQEVTARLRGKAGQRVTLALQAPDGSRRSTIARYAEIDTESVLSRMFGDIGYLWLRRFNRRTDSGMENALARLAPAGPGITPLRGLVIDIRDNQGGYLNDAVDLADLFLTAGEIARVTSRLEAEPRIYTADPSQDFAGMPVVVLMNAVSRSSAEIFAAALRDNGRAVLMGQTTYGKGVGQRTYKVKATGGSLTLVRSLVTPPSGKTFDRVGIDPDIPLARGDRPGMDPALCPPLAGSPFRDPEIACALAFIASGTSAEHFARSLSPTAGPGVEAR
jgi:carboxyl-terminal processing protease